MRRAMIQIRLLVQRSLCVMAIECLELHVQQREPLIELLASRASLRCTFHWWSGPRPRNHTIIHKRAHRCHRRLP